MTTPASYHPADPESVFTYGAPHLKFGHGAADEIGYDLSLTGARRVLVVTDPGVAATGNPQRVADQMGQFGIEAHVFDGSHVEPTDESLLRAIDYARESRPVGRLRRGRGRLEHRHRQGDQPADDQPRRADGLHQRAGRRRQGPGQPAQAADRRADDHRHRLREHDDLRDGRALACKVKTGISHARLRPTLAVIDPALTLTQPAGVTAAAGMDILCHALESYTARPYTSYERKRPEQRVPYCGSNPIADMWSEKALSLLAESFRTAVHDGDDRRTPGARWPWPPRSPGMGFGNAGRAHPARQRLPDRRTGQGLPPQGLPRRRADGAARHVGRAHGTRGVPVHLRGLPGAAPAGPPCCWLRRRTSRTTRPSCCRRCSSP